MINHFLLFGVRCLGPGTLRWPPIATDMRSKSLPSYMVNAGTFRDKKRTRTKYSSPFPLRPARASSKTKRSVSGDDDRSSSKVVHAPLHKKVLACITTSGLPYCIPFSLPWPIVTDATKSLYQVHLKIPSVCLTNRCHVCTARISK